MAQSESIQIQPQPIQNQEQYQQQDIKLLGTNKTTATNYIYFKFPHSKRHIKSKFNNLTALKEWYQQMLKYWKRKKRKIWTSQQKNKSFIIKCIYSGCYSMFRFDLQQLSKSYELKVAKLYHRHQIKKQEIQEIIVPRVSSVKTNIIKIQEEQEEIQIKQSPKLPKMQQIVKNMQDRQHFNQFLICQRINFKCCISQYDLSQQYLIFLSGMRQNFRKYGDCIRISKIISNEKYYAIFIYGSNQQNKPLLFSLILLKKIISENIKQMLLLFLKHKQTHLRTIIIEDDFNVQSAVNLLLKQYPFDGYCLFQQNQFIKSKKIQDFKIISSNEKIVITNNLQKFPSVFVGLNFIKPIQFKTTLSELNFKDNFALVNQILKLNDTLNKQNGYYEICTYKIEEAFLDQRLKNIRQNLYPTIFNFFLEIYSYAYFYCKIQKYNPYQKKHYIKDQLIDRMFEIRQYICQCNFTLKTGIPCHHLTCYLQKQKIDCLYIDFVDPRWMIDKLSKCQN